MTRPDLGADLGESSVMIMPRSLVEVTSVTWVPPFRGTPRSRTEVPTSVPTSVETT